MSKYNFIINIKDETGCVLHSMIYTTQRMQFLLIWEMKIRGVVLFGTNLIMKRI